MHEDSEKIIIVPHWYDGTKISHASGTGEMAIPICAIVERNHLVVMNNASRNSKPNQKRRQ